MAPTLTVGMAEAKTNFSRITANANRTGRTVTVFRNNRPWVEIRPLATPDVAPGEHIEGPVPEETLEAAEEAKRLMADPGTPRYRSAEELFASMGL